MRYILQDLCDMAIVQANHDWKQIKRIIRWCGDHYMEISLATVGIPLLALAIMELVCWIMLKQQNAALAELRMSLK